MVSNQDQPMSWNKLSEPGPAFVMNAVPARRFAERVRGQPVGSGSRNVVEKFFAQRQAYKGRAVSG